MPLPTTSSLSRYLFAQNTGGSYEQALAELRAGRKRSHWIWFVLPQLEGLGRSAMALRYGIHGIEEAKAYLEHPTLRSRLEEAIGEIADQLQTPGQSLERLMGGKLDATKTVSSLTLFAAAGLVSARDVLDQLGCCCERTLERLSIWF